MELRTRRTSRKRYLRTIYNKANEMNTLINELTLYSKIDTNKIPYNFQKINVKEYFMDCAEELGWIWKTSMCICPTSTMWG